MKQLGKFKSMFAVGGLVFALSASFFLGGMVMTDRSQALTEGSVTKKLEERSDKDIVAESDSFIQNSKGYAQEMLRDYADRPLLRKNEGEDWANSSLEVMLNDVNAGNGAKQAIIAACQKYGIDAQSACIGDLTVDQIVEIDQEVFRSSSHPLGE